MEQLKVIRTLEGLRELVTYLNDRPYVAFDTETTGLDKEAKIIGFSIAAEIDVGYYVILREWKDGKLQELETLNEAQFFMYSLQHSKLLMHNGIFDCAMVENNFSISLIKSLHTDTMILAHLLDENRPVNLKDLGVALFGEDARKEQEEMKASISANGGMLTKDNYELYKADANLIARYGAKDALLTLKLFYQFIPELYEQGLDQFFYEDESMPLLKGPTYELNTTGLRVDPEKLQKLKMTLEAECLDAKGFIYKEITPIVKDKYPGTGKTNTFNIGSSKQLAWLLFFQLDEYFHVLTKEGKELCKFFGIRLPYALKDKREFIRSCIENKDRVWKQSTWNPKTKKMARPKKVGDPWNYLACGKETLGKFSEKYEWVKRFLEYNKNLKLLNTYVTGIESRMKYNVIRPSFLQHGTTSGRYSSRNPNFQNLPRDDKRVKSCIIARKGKVFVGADYSQLEPRVFASFSNDKRLQASFEGKDDFYSVIGIEVFDKYDALPIKDGDPNAFGVKYKKLRDLAKVVALSSTYGTTAPKMAISTGKTIEESQEIIDLYFERFPDVKKFMLQCHDKAMNDGFVTNLYGRPRRMPKAKDIVAAYGKRSHSDLPYEVRNILNLAVNHVVQSTGASIMNRAAIEVNRAIMEKGWKDVKIVLQVHDELVLEGPEALGQEILKILKYAMENAVDLPGVKLEAIPKIAYNLADLK